jgi:hypothetical protein
LLTKAHTFIFHFQVQSFSSSSWHWDRYEIVCKILCSLGLIAHSSRQYICTTNWLLSWNMDQKILCSNILLNHYYANIHVISSETDWKGQGKLRFCQHFRVQNWRTCWSVWPKM